MTWFPAFFFVCAVTIRWWVTLTGMAHSPRSGFEQFYLKRQQPVNRFFVRRGVVGSDADDLTAEVFVIVWQKWDQAPARKREAWTYGVARNVLYAHHRRTLRDELPSSPLHVLGPPASDSVLLLETADEVQAALSALSEVDRDLLLAVIWDGLAPRDAAVALDLPASTVRVRLHRARKRFAVAYGQIVGHQTIDIREQLTIGANS